MPPLRLLVLNSEFPPVGGGSGVVNHHYFRCWADVSDLTIDLVTSASVGEPAGAERFADRITVHKVEVDKRYLHHATHRELLAYGWRGLRLARRLHGEAPYDVALAFAGVPAGAVALGLRRRYGLPYVVLLEGADIPGSAYRWTLLYKALGPVLRRVWREAGHVTAKSRDHQALANRFMPGLDIPVVHNGVDLEAFHPAASGPERDTFRILCVGRLMEAKGQQLLIRALACAALSDLPCELVLVGSGESEKDLVALARELGVADCVRFRGVVPLDEMPDVYRAADLFALVSRSEGMSLSTLEAIATGLPVVVTRVGGMSELVDGNGVFVPWGDPEALAAEIARLAASPERRRALGLRGREIAEAFGWTRAADHYLAVCRELAG